MQKGDDGVKDEKSTMLKRRPVMPVEWRCGEQTNPYSIIRPQGARGGVRKNQVRPRAFSPDDRAKRKNVFKKRDRDQGRAPRAACPPVLVGVEHWQQGASDTLPASAAES